MLRNLPRPLLHWRVSVEHAAFVRHVKDKGLFICNTQEARRPCSCGAVTSGTAVRQPYGMDHNGMDHNGMDHDGMDHNGMDHTRQVVWSAHCAQPKWSSSAT